jgi:CBS-domain-containing membrane protein
MFASALGTGVALAAVGFIGELAAAPLLIAPLGATALLIFAVPGSEMSQPRNVLLGHLVAVVFGLAASRLIGAGWPAAALATTATVLVTQSIRALHAPAGATAMLAAIEVHDWRFIGLPVMAGAATIVIVALAFNSLVPGRRYPLRWL